MGTKELDTATQPMKTHFFNPVILWAACVLCQIHIISSVTIFTCWCLPVFTSAFQTPHQWGQLLISCSLFVFCDQSYSTNVILIRKDKSVVFDGPVFPLDTQFAIDRWNLLYEICCVNLAARNHYKDSNHPPNLFYRVLLKWKASLQPSHPADGLNYLTVWLRVPLIFRASMSCVKVLCGPNPFPLFLCSQITVPFLFLE